MLIKVIFGDHYFSLFSFLFHSRALYLIGTFVFLLPPFVSPLPREAIKTCLSGEVSPRAMLRRQVGRLNARLRLNPFLPASIFPEKKYNLGSEEISRRRRFSTLPVSSGKKHLPQPRGPHSVGYVDVMTPGNPVAETSSSSSPGNPGTFVRILYPTQEQCLSEHDRWPVWVEDKYLTGMLGFMQVRKMMKKKEAW